MGRVWEEAEFGAHHGFWGAGSGCGCGCVGGGGGGLPLTLKFDGVTCFFFNSTGDIRLS